MTQREKIVELLNEYYGCDPAYFGVETESIADCLIANDVIPVVKCKDCVHCKCYYGGIHMGEYMVCNLYPFDIRDVSAHDFCSNGLRRDEYND